MKVRFATVPLILVCTLGLMAADIPVVRKDTHFPVVLQKEISTKTAKVGDVVTFRTAEGVLIGHNIVVPRGADVLGTIDEIKRDAVNSPHTVLVIRFRAVRWPEGKIDLNAVVASVESITQSEGAFVRFVHTLFSRPTLLEHVHVYAHIQQDAFTEFTSDDPEFALRPGIRLVLWHLDPDHEPEMMVRNPVLNVNRIGKE